MDNVLEIKNLKKIYHTKEGETLAVEDFTFNLKEGDFVAIVGPSGCGKSTILSVLCGLEEKSGGDIKLKKGSKIGYMLQQDSLFEWRNILDNCLLGLEINKNLNKETKEHVINLLNTYGLKDFIYSYPDNLSGGMRQRVLRILYTHK
ncbi:MAG: ATP-binding cassette domain-containing protein [Bacilli bacterium]|nr:ATP-binding cassette domain-containing protein [Bacilli bacterium]